MCCSIVAIFFALIFSISNNNWSRSKYMRRKKGMCKIVDQWHAMITEKHAQASKETVNLPLPCTFHEFGQVDWRRHGLSPNYFEISSFRNVEWIFGLVFIGIRTSVFSICFFSASYRISWTIVQINEQKKNRITSIEKHLKWTGKRANKREREREQENGTIIIYCVILTLARSNQKTTAIFHLINTWVVKSS